MLDRHEVTGSIPVHPTLWQNAGCFFKFVGIEAEFPTGIFVGLQKTTGICSSY
jgi:hypothetical protein